MLGLGIDISKQSIGSGASSAPALTDWTATSLGGITTPAATIAGDANAAQVGAWIDEANDWTGTLSDYSGIGLVIYNVTDDITYNYGNFNFNVNGGVLLTIHLITLATLDFESLVSAGAGKTVRVTFTLALDGYNDVELTTERTY